MTGPIIGPHSDESSHVTLRSARLVDGSVVLAGEATVMVPRRA